jgi:hypothetical protein
MLTTVRRLMTLDRRSGSIRTGRADGIGVEIATYR